ncbi:MAG TPA: electron transfer flavoprotein subunit beta/FixA family protein [Thermodesulfobacteriota bacterium]|nr:electron transfer flavoprotein subunit beta/FixA family protein [Thermodesulfobacteriota bacterium]
MNIAVCVKRIPKTAEADIFIEKDGRDIKKDHLVFTLNDWDGYAVREAALLKEKYGGTVTVLTIGSEESKEVLTRCLAMGADRAVRIEEPPAQDSRLISKILAQALKAQPFDLILTGVQAEDDNCGQIGPSLAQMLGLPHAAIVNRVEISGNMARVKRELEGGIEEAVDLKLPAVLTIQTGINEPKYVSLAAILDAEDKETEEVPLEKTGVALDQPLDATIDQVFFPPAGKMAEILKGTPEEVVMQLTEIVRKKKG